MKRTPWLTLALLLIAPIALAQDTPPAEPQTPPAPPPPQLILRELLVLQTDRYDDTANNPKLISTTLFNPVKHHDRAKRTKDDGSYDYSPMPLGLITFQGTLKEPIKLRLTLQDQGDRFHAHWPDNAIIGERLLQWEDLAAASEQDRAVTIAQEQDWLDALREGEDRLWLEPRGGPFKERYLLYDASFKFKPAIELALTDAQYRLSAVEPDNAAPPLAVLLRKAGDNWTADAITGPWASDPAVIAGKASDNSAAVSLPEALAPVKELLKQRGYNKSETDLALGMIASAGLDQSTMSLVYILPPGLIDEHIRLQVKPQPDEIIRTAIVVINNVDPDLGSQVQALIADLGSDQWLKRDRAQRQLSELGQAALKQVQALKNSKDPEVAFRARQILDNYDWKMGTNR